MKFDTRVTAAEARNGIVMPAIGEAATPDATEIVRDRDVVFYVGDQHISFDVEPRRPARGAFLITSIRDPQYCRIARPPQGNARIIVCDVRSDARIAQTRHLSAIQEFCMLDESDRQLIRIFYAAMRFDAAGIRVTEDQRLMGAAARATLAKTSAGSLRLWDGWLAPLLAAAEKQLMEAGVEIPGPSPESVRLQAENEERRKVIAESQAYNAAIAEKARQDRCSGSSATFEKAEWQLLEKLGAVSFEAKAERFRELTFDEQCDVTLRVRKWQRELDEKAKDLDHRDAGVTGGTDRTAEVSQVAGSSRVTDTVESDVIASLGRKGAN